MAFAIFSWEGPLEWGVAETPREVVVLGGLLPAKELHDAICGVSENQALGAHRLETWLLHYRGAK